MNEEKASVKADGILLPVFQKGVCTLKMILHLGQEGPNQMLTTFLLH